MSNKPFVTTLPSSLAPSLKRGLRDKGFTLSQPEYTEFCGKKKGVSCTLYRSGKLVVSGKEKEDFIRFWLEPEILGTFTYGYKEELAPIDTTPRIGIDESGKGDFFGPLCIAGVYADASQITKLAELGVKDSKNMSDKAIRALAKKIRPCCTHHFIRVNPLKYNELYVKFNNLNTFLAWGHASTIEELVQRSGCDNVLIDQFAARHVVENALLKKKLRVQLKQRHRAEEDTVVAAASILARDAFLEGMEKLSDQLGIQLPKGASAKVQQIGRQIVAKHGPDMLRRVAKTHFKTYKIIVQEM